MRGKQSFKQIAAFLLALCMTLEMLPISVVAAELDQTQEQREEETTQPSSPSLSAGDIKTDENGKVTVVKCGDGMSQADALQLLFSGRDLSQTTPGKNAGLESSGLSEDVYESASELHGNETALNRELAELFSERERDGLDETAYENIKLLICSGYSYRQARAAIVSAKVLDCTVEELCKAKIEEISEHRYSDASVETDETVEEDGPAAEEFSAIDSIAIKMGIPPKLLASKMEQQAVLSADSALNQFQGLMDSQYQYLPTDSSVAPPTEAASASDADAPAISYHPDKPLSNPFDYKQNGKLKVNMADGSYIFSETDLSIPGINGLDLNIVRQFDSKFANVTDPYGETTGRHKNEKTLKVSFDAYVSYDFTSSANDSDYQYVADFTQYTIWDQATNSSVHSTKPTFYTYDYNQAVVKAQELSDATAGTYYGADDPDGESCIVKLRATVKGIGNFDDAFVNTSFNYNNNRQVTHYGLGQGWRLGFSSIETYLAGLMLNGDPIVKRRLTLSDGRQYAIDEDWDIVSDIHDMYLTKNSGYPNAFCTLVYQDGRKEHFDDNGRNIAIEDRFGNRITLDYTPSADGLSKITITDTLGNIVTYQEETVVLGESDFIKVPGTKYDKYNKKWTLALNGNTVRTYYSYQYDEETYGGLRYLTAVADEVSQLTRISTSPITATYNTFSALASTNDGTIYRAALSSILYPNGCYLSITHNTQHLPEQSVSREVLGEGGYIQTHFIDTLKNYASGDRGNVQGETSHIFGDYTGYYFALDEVTTYSCVETSHHLTPGVNCRYSWKSHDIEYTFDNERNMTKKEQFEYPSVSEIGFVESDLNLTSRRIGKSSASTYSYTYNGLPSYISTKTYEPGNDSHFMTTSHSYQYDTAGNVLRETRPNGQTTVCTYGSYGIPLTKTYNQDKDTVIVETNTLTADQKSISTSTTKVNGELRAKKDFTYDTKGRITEIKDYLSETDQIIQQLSYGNSAKATETKTLQVKTADGAAAVSSPGYTNGTVAEKASYNDRGLPVTYTDGNGNITSYTYDATGKVTAINYPDGTHDLYSYDVANRTAEHTDTNGNVTVYRYSVFGEVVGVSDKASGQILASYKYDSLGRLNQQTDYRYGSTTTTEYDSQDRLMSERTTDSSNVVLSETLYSYDNAAEQGTYSKSTKTVVGDANAPPIVTTQYTDKNGDVIKTGKFLGGTEHFDTYTYDYQGNQLTKLTAKDAAKGLSFTEKQEYNHAGQVVKYYNAAGNSTENSYDWLGRKISSTDYAGTPTTYTYDALGRLLSQTITVKSGVTSTTKYDYDAGGDLIRERKPVQAVGSTPVWAKTEYRYDSRGNLISAAQYQGDAVASATRYTYDGEGNMLTMTTGLSSPDASGGSTTTYTYDRFGSVLSETDPLGQAETYSYAPTGKLLSMTDRGGAETQYTYDALGRTLSTVAGDDQVWYTYSKNGQVLSEENGNYKTEYAYDELGRVTEISESDKEADPELYITITLDANGGTVSPGTRTVKVGSKFMLPTPTRPNYYFTGWYFNGKEIANGTVVTFKEDCTLVAGWTQDTYTITYYPAYNNLSSGSISSSSAPDELSTSVRDTDDPAANVSLGTPVSIEYPCGKSITLAGAIFRAPNLVLSGWSRQSNSGKITYRLNQKNLVDLAPKGKTLSLYGVWQSGTTISPPPGEISDVGENETATLSSSSNLLSYTKTFTYDLDGNRTGLTVKRGTETLQRTTYFYDELNRLIAVAENGTVAATYTYDVNGNRASLTYSNGNTTTYSYNAANWITRLENRSSTSLISAFDYTYYASGAQRSKTDDAGVVTSYTYDHLGRLTRESETNALTVDYRYDANSNRVQMAVSGTENYTVGYTYDAANRLTASVKTQGTAATTAAYTYDADGNLLTQNEDVSDPAGLVTYGYDGFQRQTSVTAGDRTTTYAYNAQGIRTSKTCGSSRTSFLLDGGNVIAELSNGTLTAKYLRGMNLISRTDSSRTTYYLFNAHGDVVDLANSSGSSVKSYDYDAFGNEKSPSASDRNPFRYCGEYWDTETGTYYLRARYYDPLIGRFTQQDSHWTSTNAIYGDNPNQLAQREDALGLTNYTYSPQISCILQSGNLYVYCINDPINGSDPDGEVIIPNIVAGVFVGALAGLASDIVSRPGDYYKALTGDPVARSEVLASGGRALIGGAISGGFAAAGVSVKAQTIVDAVIGAADSVAADVRAIKSGQDYSVGDVLAHAIVSAGISAAFSYAGSDSSGTEMSSLHKKAKAAEKTAKTKGTHPTAKKAAKKTAGKYTRKAKSYWKAAAYQGTISNTSANVVKKLYNGAYDYYTR